MDNFPKEEDKWISVEDRLPENETNVLCYGKGDRYFTAHHYEKGFFIDADAEELDNENVTHWMPLPQQPKI